MHLADVPSRSWLGRFAEMCKPEVSQFRIGRSLRPYWDVTCGSSSVSWRDFDPGQAQRRQNGAHVDGDSRIGIGAEVSYTVIG